MTRIARSLALFVLLVVLATPAASQTTLAWRMANEYPATSMPGEGDTHFARWLAEKSGGRITITPHFDASLGFRSKDLIEAVAKGTVQLGNMLMGAVGGADPLFLLPSLPFVATTPEQARLLFEVARPEYERALARHNQRLLFVTPWPPSGVWAKMAITSVDALQGLRIRTYDANGTLTFRKAGAAPAQISFADALPRLRAGELDAVLSSGDGGVGARLWELLAHFTEINYVMPLSMATINLDTWNALAPDLQAIVTEAAEQTTARQWAEIQRRVEANYARMRASGTTITTTVPADFSRALRDAGQAAADEWVARAGPRGRELLEAYRRRLEAR